MAMKMASALLLSIAYLSACGTVSKGATQAVQITSAPEGAHFVVSPSGQTGTAPAELELERRFDHTIELSYPGYQTRKAFVRRHLATGPQWANIASCLLLPFVCMAGAGADEKSGGMFNLMPNPLHVELEPGSERPEPVTLSRVNFFNASNAANVTFSVDGGEECRLGPGQYAKRVVQSGMHRIDVFHWDVFKMKGASTLEFSDAEMNVAIACSVYSTHAAFDNEMPVDFQEACVERGSRPLSGVPHRQVSP
jgi:hypothetical protein